MNRYTTTTTANSAIEEKSPEVRMDTDNIEEDCQTLAAQQTLAIQEGIALKRQEEAINDLDLLLSTQNDNGKRQRVDVYMDTNPTDTPTLTVDTMHTAVNWFTDKRIELHRTIKNCKKKTDSQLKLQEHAAKGTFPKNLHTQLTPYDQWPNELSPDEKQTLILNEQKQITTLQQSLLAGRIEVYSKIVENIEETIRHSLQPLTILTNLQIEINKHTPQQEWTIEALHQNTTIKNQIILMTETANKTIAALKQTNQNQNQNQNQPPPLQPTPTDNNQPDEDISKLIALLRLDVQNLQQDNGNLTIMLAEQRTTTTNNHTYDNSSRIRSVKNGYGDGIDKRTPSRTRGVGPEEYTSKSPPFRHNTPRSQDSTTTTPQYSNYRPYNPRYQSPYNNNNNHHQQSASPHGGRERDRGVRGYQGRPENRRDYNRKEEHPYDKDSRNRRYDKN